MDEITIEDFIKVDLRIAKVKEAVEVPEADKLIKLVLDVGEEGEKTVFAGIKSAYALDELQGCLLYTSPSPRDAHESRMPSSA